jgi:hypothetical protein
VGADRLTERVLDMVDDAFGRGLAAGEVIDSIDFTITMLPTPAGMQLVGLLYICVKGPLLGTVLSNTDVITDLGMLSSQEFVDDRVRVGLESIRTQKAQLLSAGNGHAQGVPA